MQFKEFVECINQNPTLKITVNHELVDKLISEDKILSQKYRECLKKELDEGLNLDDFLVAIANNFLPRDLVKIFSEGEFYLK